MRITKHEHACLRLEEQGKTLVIDPGNFTRPLEGLHDVSILVTTVDASTQGALGRFDARGVSFDNALKLAAHYLEGFAWTNSSKAK